MDYIAIFNQLLEDDRVLYSPKHQNLVKVINHILDSYFKTLEKNPFLLIESFFRFTNRDQMIQVLNNYEYLGDYDPVLDNIKEKVRIANIKAENFKAWSV